MALYSFHHLNTSPPFFFCIGCVLVFPGIPLLSGTLDNKHSYMRRDARAALLDSYYKLPRNTWLVSHYRRKTGRRQFLALENPIKTNIADYKYLSLHEDWLQVSEYNYCFETEWLAKKNVSDLRCTQRAWWCIRNAEYGNLSREKLLMSFLPIICANMLRNVNKRKCPLIPFKLMNFWGLNLILKYWYQYWQQNNCNCSLLIQADSSAGDSHN